jgi:hypothetical protein
MSKKKFTLEMPDDNDLAFFSKQYVNLGEVNAEIEKLEASIPDKRTKEYENWKTKVNFLMDMYNRLASYKAFKKYD